MQDVVANSGFLDIVCIGVGRENNFFKLADIERMFNLLNTTTVQIGGFFVVAFPIRAVVKLVKKTRLILLKISYRK